MRFESSLVTKSGGDLVIDVIESLYGTIAEESSNLSTSTKTNKITMENLYEQLEELIDTIKYSHAAGDENPDYLENDYFEEVVEACKEILKYTDN